MDDGKLDMGKAVPITIIFEVPEDLLAAMLQASQDVEAGTVQDLMLQVLANELME